MSQKYDIIVNDTGEWMKKHKKSQLTSEEKHGENEKSMQPHTEQKERIPIDFLLNERILIIEWKYDV